MSSACWWGLPICKSQGSKSLYVHSADDAVDETQALCETHIGKDGQKGQPTGAAPLSHLVDYLMKYWCAPGRGLLRTRPFLGMVHITNETSAGRTTRPEGASYLGERATRSLLRALGILAILYHEHLSKGVLAHSRANPNIASGVCCHAGAPHGSATWRRRHRPSVWEVVADTADSSRRAGTSPATSDHACSVRAGLRAHLGGAGARVVVVRLALVVAVPLPSICHAARTHRNVGEDNRRARQSRTKLGLGSAFSLVRTTSFGQNTRATLRCAGVPSRPWDRRAGCQRTSAASKA